MNKKHDPAEFGDLANLLTNAGIDDTSIKNRIFNRLKYKLETGTIQTDFPEKRGVSMKKNQWKSIAIVASMLVCLGGVFSTTSYAQEMLLSIMARFQVGNMEITQYDKELPELELNRADAKEQGNESKRRIQRETPQHKSLEEARTALGINFPAPKWLSDQYNYMNSVVHGDNAVEVQYQKDKEFISLLISKGGKNGISTTEEVKPETISGKTVYFANGIVIWEHEGFTYELYQMAETNFDKDTIGKIISSLSTETK